MKVSQVGVVVGLSGPPRTTSPLARLSNDRGSVLLETALAIPMLFAIAMSLLWALGVGTTALALGDTAREAARSIARGESVDSVARRTSNLAPRAEVTIDQADGLVSVELVENVRIPIPMLDGLAFTVHRSAQAASEVLVG